MVRLTPLVLRLTPLGGSPNSVRGDKRYAITPLRFTLERELVRK